MGERSRNDCCRGKATGTVRHEVGLDKPVSGPPRGKFCGNGNIQKIITQSLNTEINST
jgi:hypothetical protein